MDFTLWRVMAGDWINALASESVVVSREVENNLKVFMGQPPPTREWTELRAFIEGLDSYSRHERPGTNMLGSNQPI